jgi:hypothetical protein
MKAEQFRLFLVRAGKFTRLIARHQPQCNKIMLLGRSLILRARGYHAYRCDIDCRGREHKTGCRDFAGGCGRTGGAREPGAARRRTATRAVLRHKSEGGSEGWWPTPEIWRLGAGMMSCRPSSALQSAADHRQGRTELMSRSPLASRRELIGVKSWRVRRPAAGAIATPSEGRAPVPAMSGVADLDAEPQGRDGGVAPACR